MEINKIIFTDNYVKQRDKIDPSDLAKLEQAISVHGYRGPSKNRRYGVVPIRSADVALFRIYNNSSFGLSSKYQPVKVVAHVPNGNRLVGALEKGFRDSSQILHIIEIGNDTGKVWEKFEKIDRKMIKN